MMYKDDLGFTIYLKKVSTVLITGLPVRKWVLDKEGYLFGSGKDLRYVLKLYAIALIENYDKCNDSVDVPCCLVYVKKKVEDVLEYVEKNKLSICTKYE